MISKFWLVHWTHIESSKSTLKPHSFLIGIYASIGFSQGLCIWILVFSLALASYNASDRLHFQLLDVVIHCPMSFFDTTPSGRIFNRFTKDINNLDYQIPQNLMSLLVDGMAIAGVIYVMSFVTPYALIFFACFFVIYFTIQVFISYSSFYEEFYFPNNKLKQRIKHYLVALKRYFIHNLTHICVL